MIEDLLFERTYHYEEAFKHIKAVGIENEKIEQTYNALLSLIKDSNLMTEYKNWCIQYEEY